MQQSHRAPAPVAGALLHGWPHLVRRVSTFPTRVPCITWRKCDGTAHKHLPWTITRRITRALFGFQLQIPSMKRAPRLRAVTQAVRATAFICVLAAVTSLGGTTGTLEGRLLATASGGAQLADQPNATPDYSQFLLIVRSSDARTEIARTKPDAEGSYRVSLPPGEYVLAVEKQGGRPTRAAPQKFTITADKTIRVDTAVLPNLQIAAPDRSLSN